MASLHISFTNLSLQPFSLYLICTAFLFAVTVAALNFSHSRTTTFYSEPIILGGNCAVNSPTVPTKRKARHQAGGGCKDDHLLGGADVKVTSCEMPNSGLVSQVSCTPSLSLDFTW
ncbi:hypothetical protein K469DRAFT_326381 [Zopfia rhizophila CBS 207.26]|uniref:Uncharacterized protein n=1 Tax=Zopfia rhizophila CBS 207.26 TaxID=1314779 RepID=A0A6A6DIZ3_9PEZI|nr:hypothetical protein K469DRAFT_326381 [Zopfia rhizophila CBS 207.26]